MIDPDTPEGRWLKRLSEALQDRRNGYSDGKKWSRQLLSTRRVRMPLDILEDYRAGDPPLRPDIHSGWKPHVRQFYRMGRLNVADQIITTTANRMQLRDFRTAAAGDRLGDKMARDIMRANGMKVKTREVSEKFLALGDAYTIVTPPNGSRRWPVITAEDPRQVITAHDPVTGRIIAGLKMFRSEWDDEDLAYLYLPGSVLKFRATGRTTISSGRGRFDKDRWIHDEDKDDDVPGGEIPIARFRNRDGVGEFERHVDHLDRINDKIFDEWWTAKIQAFRQRAVKNLPDTIVEVGEDGEETEKPVPEGYYDDMFTASPDEMWQVPGDVEFWESQPVDLTPITNAIEKDRQRLASTLSIPLHTVTPDAANGSAEGASLIREEHVFKVEDRIDRASDGWARTMSLAFLFQGDTDRADITQLEPLWGPVERHSLNAKGSAAAQLKDVLPREAIQRDVLQYPPAEIPELTAMRATDLVFQAPGQPPRGSGTAG